MQKALAPDLFQACLTAIERFDHPARMPVFAISKPLNEGAVLRALAFDHWAEGSPLQAVKKWTAVASPSTFN